MIMVTSVSPLIARQLFNVCTVYSAYCVILIFFFPLAKDETTLLARNYLGTRMVKYKQQSAQSIIDTETFNYV